MYKPDTLQDVLTKSNTFYGKPNLKNWRLGRKTGVPHFNTEY